MLHTLIHSPFEINVFSLIRMLKISDDFLALQDGVLIAMNNNIFLEKILISPATFYVLKEDVYARGLYKNIAIPFTMISYIHFVELTIKNRQQMSW